MRYVTFLYVGKNLRTVIQIQLKFQQNFFFANHQNEVVVHNILGGQPQNIRTKRLIRCFRMSDCKKFIQSYWKNTVKSS